MRWIPQGLRVNEYEATSISVVWACIQAISTAIASSPWDVYRVAGRRREYLPDDPLSYLLNQRANPENLPAVAFREAMLFGALATGNAYAEIERDGGGRVIGVSPLVADQMQLERDESGALVYHYSDPGGNPIYYSPDEIFHLRGPVSVAGLMGDSTVGRASKAIALAAAAERFAVHYLANGTVTSGVLSYPAKLDPKSFERIREQWKEKRSGPATAGNVIILEGGMKYEAISADPDRAQLLETQSWTVENIARYFGVPLVKLGVPSSSQGYGSNISQLNLQWARDCLTPWRLRLEQEANVKLLSPRPYRETRIDLEWLSRGDAKEAAEADKIRLESGVWSVNEIRERNGENSIGPEGDIRFVSNSLVPLTTTLLEIQEAQAEPPEPTAPPGAGADEEAAGDEEADGEGDDPGPLAIVALAGALGRYGARMRARRRDLERSHGPGGGGPMYAEAREAALPGALVEAAAILSLAGATVPGDAIQAALDSVAAGVDPEAAARNLWRNRG